MARGEQQLWGMAMVLLASWSFMLFWVVGICGTSIVIVSHSCFFFVFFIISKITTRLRNSDEIYMNVRVPEAP
jgi:hypothetical protein